MQTQQRDVRTMCRLDRVQRGAGTMISELDHGKCKVLYNSQLLFRHRLYADLETILYRVHLSEPLSWLMKQPSLYIHDAVPRDAFQALSRIHWICYYSTSLREVITGDLLPSSDMIKALSQEFGLPVSWEQLRGAKLLAMPPHPAPNLEDLQSWGSTLPNEIRAHQEKYPQWQNTRLLKKRGQKHSLIQVGILSPRSGVPGLHHTWAVQLPAGRYRADGQFLSGASASGLYLISLQPWRISSFLKGEKERS
ncbi:PREDICTED: uncharacterized protein FLJ43738-like [Ceratotherium simum simum]|uniref:Uncharacterized protein FLJ43738-like n=1 Tax=Ceratotherium simum simum TaxID=73337 RepID=A0ABM1C695_CERSS|nr:PREDICTED: uncharacterized protein FLJ43738-like [Ceratotherium simum simum]